MVNKNDAHCIGIPKTDFEAQTHHRHLTYPYGKYQISYSFKFIPFKKKTDVHQ
jgi:hypothetical protein